MQTSARHAASEPSSSVVAVVAATARQHALRICTQCRCRCDGLRRNFSAPLATSAPYRGARIVWTAENVVGKMGWGSFRLLTRLHRLTKVLFVDKDIVCPEP